MYCISLISEEYFLTSQKHIRIAQLGEQGLGHEYAQPGHHPDTSGTKAINRK